jgi:hypothetical protein
MKTLIEEYNEFADLIMKISIESQKYEIAAWIRRVKKELAYTVVFEEELEIEDFLKLMTKELKILDEKDQKIVIPHLRDFKFRMLNI